MQVEAKMEYMANRSDIDTRRKLDVWISVCARDAFTLNLLLGG